VRKRQRNVNIDFDRNFPLNSILLSKQQAIGIIDGDRFVSSPLRLYLLTVTMKSLKGTECRERSLVTIMILAHISEVGLHLAYWARGHVTEKQ
jgi:hypothetical protein